MKNQVLRWNYYRYGQEYILGTLKIYGRKWGFLALPSRCVLHSMLVYLSDSILHHFYAHGVHESHAGLLLEVWA